MKNKDRDILAEALELKKMPYSTPEGYFDSFKANMKPSVHPHGQTFVGQLMPYAAMAAMFLFLVTGGTFILRHATPQEDLTQEDFIVFSTGMTNTLYYEDMNQIADAGIADEDIIEYLIYSGISAEEIELSK